MLSQLISFFKKIFLCLVLVTFLGTISSSKIWAEEQVLSDADYSGQVIHLFASKTCPHCADEKIFLEDLKIAHPELKIYHYEIAFAQNSKLLTEVAYFLKVNGQGVPFTVIGNQVTVGFSDLTPGKIYQMLDEQKRQQSSDVVINLTKEAQLVPIIEEFKLDKILVERKKNDQLLVEKSKEQPKDNSSIDRSQIDGDELNLPLFGSINLKEASLPILTVMIAFLDGFNPCAMWVLMFLISLLLGIKNRRRMWLLGGAFIFASGLVYFLFMSAWLNLFLFIGLVSWVRILIGCLALFAAYSYLKDYVKNKDGACQIDLAGRKQRIFERLKLITHRDNLLWALIGIVALAFMVNLLELVCSAGLPAVYTQVLSLNDLPSWQYYLYLLLYILIFMLDDMVIFVLAMIGMKSVGLNSKYARYSHLIGGILMLLIGLAMLFKPELIMFG